MTKAVLKAQKRSLKLKSGPKSPKAVVKPKSGSKMEFGSKITIQMKTVLESNRLSTIDGKKKHRNYHTTL